MEVKDVAWFCTAISFLACYLGAKKIRACWLVWEVSTIGLVLINLYYQQYGQMTLWLGYIILNAYGYYKWKP